MEVEVQHAAGVIGDVANARGDHQAPGGYGGGDEQPARCAGDDDGCAGAVLSPDGFTGGDRGNDVRSASGQPDPTLPDLPAELVRAGSVSDSGREGLTDAPPPAPAPRPVPVAPAAPAEAQGGLISGQATHYGESYNGQPLGCAGAGLYSSDNPNIAAVSPARYQEWPCGTKLRLCGPGGCAVVTRVDSCPGCYANLIDLSESANRLVCATERYPYPHTCAVTIEVLR